MKDMLGKEIEVTAHDLGSSGEGVATWNEITVFVEGLLPGEMGKVVVTDVRKNFLRAQLKTIGKKSPFRIEPICPVFDQCGGCQLMHLDYAKQLEWKKSRVEEALKRIGKISQPEVHPTHPSPKPLYYRNKMHLPCTLDQGKSTLGLYKKKSHEVVPVEKCYIHTDIGDQAYQEIVQVLRNSPLSVYDEKKRKGVLRSILMRTSRKDSSILVMIVTTKSASEELKKLAHQIYELPHIKGVVHGLNRQIGNSLFPEKITPLQGESVLPEEILGLSVQLSAQSFFQVNIEQAEEIYNAAFQMADIQEGESALDLFCGTGVFACYLAKQGVDVTGIEVVPQAVADARENAKRNGLEARWIEGRVEEHIDDLQTFDVVFVNPPRKGCDPSIWEKVSTINPRRIVYTSCNPATLARDAACLEEIGYRAVEFRPFDMFPQTVHVETVALFVKKA